MSAINDIGTAILSLSKSSLICTQLKQLCSDVGIKAMQCELSTDEAQKFTDEVRNAWWEIKPSGEEKYLMEAILILAGTMQAEIKKWNQ